MSGPHTCRVGSDRNRWQLGHDVVRHVERVTAGVAHDDEARRFGRPSPPVVCRTSVLGVIHIVVLAERFELCYELPVAAR